MFHESPGLAGKRKSRAKPQYRIGFIPRYESTGGLVWFVYYPSSTRGFRVFDRILLDCMGPASCQPFRGNPGWKIRGWTITHFWGDLC